ncbi:helix-turn-helix domain-containing protein [Anaerotignum sp.]|uniref:helix-turn-helix domain-containing protein n=1 Tax=Anaerotignum sp. TaxID=2039241 RepID=UPI0028ABF109|nr:helix-turn-helix transcriptional regulator [Anaerotignum sp.]
MYSIGLCYILSKKNGRDDILPKLTLGEKLKELRFAKGYKNREDLAKVINIPKTTLNDYENDEKSQDVGYVNLITLAKFYVTEVCYAVKKK